MLEQLIAEYLIEAKRGVYGEYYPNIDVNRLADELAEKFINDNDLEIERYVDDELLRY